VVIANFSDFTSAGGVAANIGFRTGPPRRPESAGAKFTQDRFVAPEHVAREPVFSWEAKVYVLV